MTLAMVVVASATATGRARAALEPCVNAVKELHCDPMPEGAEARRSMLLGLDVSARQAVAANQRRAAARFFGCLLLADPRPENAANLAVVLKQSGALPGALDAAMCAERLALPNSATAVRARARRMEIAQLLSQLQPPPFAATATAVVAAPVPPPPPPEGDSPVIPGQPESHVLATPPPAPPLLPPPPPRSDAMRVLAPVASGGGGEAAPAAPAGATAVLQLSRGDADPGTRSPSQPAGYRTPVLVCGGIATILGGGVGAVAYFLSHSRAAQFRQEQSNNGFTTRAKELQHRAELWQITSITGFLAAGVAAATMVIVW